VIKSSTGNWSKCIYPYDEDGKLVSEGLISEQSPLKYKWLCENRERLEARATTEPWYAFGRTQAINDTYKDKWAIKSIIKNLSDVNPVKAPAGTGVYGGLYIICEDESQLDCLKTEEFLDYVKLLKKYKSGGYYTFSSKDLENYLNWKNYAQVKEHEA
jgi:adenine-specific DNA-methyltransferase